MRAERFESPLVTSDPDQYAASGSDTAELPEAHYRHFGRLGAREYYELSRDIASYIHDEGVRSVVLTDKAARPAYIGLLRYWRALYPDEERPAINFMNPLGLQPVEDMSLLQRARGADERFRAGLGNIAIAPRTKDGIAEEFRTTFAELLARKEDPVLVLDTCLHSGGSALSILLQLLQNDFTDVRIGVVRYEPVGRPLVLVPDIVFRPEGTVTGCYPFGQRDCMVSKTFDQVTSVPSSPVDRETGRSLRAEAQRIIAEGLRASGHISTIDGKS